MNIKKTTKTKRIMLRKQKQLIFYILLVALPVLQFCVFYIGVNINSFLLAFRNYDIETASYSWAGLTNFSKVLQDIFMPGYIKTAFKNSFILFGTTLFLGMTLALCFSYYIYKKMRFSGFFRITLFLPHIISAIVTVLMFKYFSDRAIPEIFFKLTGKNINGLVSETETAFVTILFYTVWAGFGTQVLLYTGAMGAISESVIEAGKLDGTTPFKEFIYLIIPGIYPTFVTFVVINTANMFLNQMNLFSFYGHTAEFSLYTVGYFLFRSVQTAKTFAEYPYLSAFGLVLTAVAIPITLGLRSILDKIGPSTD